MWEFENSNYKYKKQKKTENSTRKMGIIKQSEHYCPEL